MYQDEPIPYAWAPTKSGSRLSHSVDQPVSTVELGVESSSGPSSADTTPGRPIRAVIETDSSNSTPGRPISDNMSFRVPSSSDEEQPIVPAVLFHRRQEPQIDDPIVAETQVQEAESEDQEQPERVPCTCGRCDEMPHPFENRCCQREPLTNTHLHDYEHGKCLLECAAVQHVISETSVQLSWLSNMRYFGHTGDALMFGNMTHKNYRFHAYRNYIDLLFGKLGKFNRRVIPACVVVKIRQTWPDPDGNYVGFKGVDENGEPVDETELV